MLIYIFIAVSLAIIVYLAIDQLITFNDIFKNKE